MPYKLTNRNVLVTGGSRGLGEVICLKFAAEGCNVAINYVSSEDKARELKKRIEEEWGVKVVCLKGDMSQESDCISVVKETIKEFGGLDIIVSNAGYTRFSNFADLSAPTAEDWQKCYATNVVAQTFLLKEALPTFQANEEGGSFIMTSSIAGVGAGGSCMPYSVTKAAQLHLMKCLAATQGPKVRVNAVLPGLLLTEWGKKYSEEDQERLKDRAFLKQVTDLEDCAQAFVDIAKNSSMTGQKIQVDAGLAQNV
ncbi:hypothetical protein sscle_09g071680 [Sclerotinia sclerotiorum 1980 UF-70]|uniref:Short-chain dehydrogenase/reductase ABA4 n=1 Tax=Sclerotinia sclerotiorum (strain ATCC 18683 / 1980 / Ss-1) TaxID=665079 RepID=A0A1D9QBV2_SCLS1|nr:hypothetical protein sscle_09g071680 [Sclerotinia sclerotiorum 1980 UF-70]